jgi:hypothetical protein
MKRILIVSLSEVSKDPRILRQIETLSSIYELHVVGYGEASKEAFAFYELVDNSFGHSGAKRKLVKTLFLLLRRFKDLYFYESRTNIQKKSGIENQDYDLILANDFDSLPLIKYSINQKSPILLDAHEYYFDEIYSPVRGNLFRPYRKWVAGSASGRIVGMSTVSSRIARLYSDQLRIVDISLIRNTPKKNSMEFQNHNSYQISIIHHGIAVDGRGIRELISLMHLLDKKFFLNLMLVETDTKFFNDLRQFAKPLGDRVKFINPVPTKEIVTRISTFDLGIFLLPPRSINNRFALPNKFFEYIQARLGIITGPSLEMLEILEEHDLGIASSTFDLNEIATVMNRLDRSQVEKFRLNAHKSSEIFCWEEESKVLVSQISRLIGASGEE